MDDKLVDKIIKAYAKALENNRALYRSELDLPYSKDKIRRALAIKSLYDLEASYRTALEKSYLWLENFLPKQEFEIVDPWQTFMQSEEPNPEASQEDKQQFLAKLAKFLPSQAKYLEVEKVVNKRWDERWKEMESIRRIIGLEVIDAISRREEERIKKVEPIRRRIMGLPEE